MPDSQLNQSLMIDEFWAWLTAHYNCILRAGGPGFVVFDQPDIHWHLGVDPDGIMFVQLIKGKESTMEFFLNPGDVLYVQSSPEEDDQTLFECIGGSNGQPEPLCHFLTAHPYDDEQAPASRAWTH